MKTLDEVIACLDGCGHIDCDDCPYHYEDEKIEVDDCAQSYKDALHYLKEYKRVQTKIEKIALGNIEDTLVKLDNKPLTWDELKTMEGKPVWVECWLGKRWGIIEKIDNVDGVEIAYCIVSPGHRWSLYAEDTDKIWQAYRKERG